MATSGQPVRGTQEDALNFAYMYGYPLLEYGKFVSAFPNAAANTLYHDRRLSTSNDRKVIRPNVDTLYSTIFLDVSSKDLELVIPKIDGRYWCFSCYDPYGNNIANISSLKFHGAGKYLIRYASEGFGFSEPPTPNTDGQRGYIDLPTAYGILLARIVVIPHDEDQALVNRLQDKISVTEVARASETIVSPPLPLSLFTAAGYEVARGVSTAQAVLRLTAAIAHFNPPIVAEDRAWVSKTLFQSGIYRDPSLQVDAAAQHRFAEGEAHSALRSANGRLDHGNGWSSSFPDCLGLFHSNYSARYYIAKRGYLGLTKDQAVYPSLSGTLFIEPNAAILIRFSRRPVLGKGGFWSLTAYTADQYLVPNEMRRYCLGDRDNMTFADPQTPLSAKTKDGHFYILLQAADTPPPAIWRSNWLPAPAGGGKMSVTLRWYGATEEMMNGAYQYPNIEHIKAVTDDCQAKL